MFMKSRKTIRFHGGVLPIIEVAKARRVRASGVLALNLPSKAHRSTLGIPHMRQVNRCTNAVGCLSVDPADDRLLVG